jgi:hypothetical protein
MGAVRICRRCASKSSAKPQQRESPNWHQFGLFDYGCQPRHCKILFICTISIPSASQPKLYNLHHSERTPLYQTVAGHCETSLDLFSAGQLDVQSDHCTPRPYVRQAFCKHLERGLLMVLRIFLRVIAHDRAGLEQLRHYCAHCRFLYEVCRCYAHSAAANAGSHRRRDETTPAYPRYLSRFAGTAFTSLFCTSYTGSVTRLIFGANFRVLITNLRQKLTKKRKRFIANQV